MDRLRQGIHLRGYAAKKNKQEYEREAFELFSLMLVEIKHEAIEHTYPEKTVLLDVWIVMDFGGEAYGREGQAVR